MEGLLWGVAAMLVKDTFSSPYKKGRDYERNVRQAWRDVDNLEVALARIREHGGCNFAPDFVKRAEAQYRRASRLLTKAYPRDVSTGRLLHYSTDFGGQERLLAIGHEANQTTRTLNDLLGEMRFRKIIAKGTPGEDLMGLNVMPGEQVEATTTVRGRSPSPAATATTTTSDPQSEAGEEALDRLLESIDAVTTSQDNEEGGVAMERLMKTLRRALRYQRSRSSLSPRDEYLTDLLEDLDEAFTRLLKADGEREKRRAIKYLGRIFQEVEGALRGRNERGRAESPESVSPPRSRRRGYSVPNNNALRGVDDMDDLRRSLRRESVTRGMKQTAR